MASGVVKEQESEPTRREQEGEKQASQARSHAVMALPRSLRVSLSAMETPLRVLSRGTTGRDRIYFSAWAATWRMNSQFGD